MNISIINIGDELLQGFTLNTNALWLGKKLSQYGINICKVLSIPDNHDAIIYETKNILKENNEFLFVTGGLGPTHDDITKNAFCELFSDELYFDETYYASLEKKYKSLLKELPKINRSQAMLLKNAKNIPNDLGSALGIHYVYKKTNIFIMPGVPREMKNMINNYIIPDFIKLKQINNQVTIRTSGITESVLYETLSPLIKKYSSEFKFAFLPHYNGVSFRIIKNNKSFFELNEIKNEFINAMQPYYYGINDDSLEMFIADKLLNKNYTIATAESCTGGLVGKRLSDLPGSSQYFLGTITAYSNTLKENILNISKNTIKQYGAVSKETALEMAKNIRNITDADIGISTTGISGPTGDTKKKPLGLIYIAINTSKLSKVKKYIFNTERYIHRELSTTTALNLIRHFLNN